jgi:5'-nucleotidase / UDP-sugar diphosphatase
MVKYRLFTLLLLCFPVCEASFAQTMPEKKLIILYTNDLHSRVSGFPSGIQHLDTGYSEADTLGGFARIATLIKEEKQLNGDNVLVLDAGDFLMGTFFAMLEESTGFQLSLMKKMGYDAVTLGNHEFDFGPQILANIIAKSADNGYVPSLVASNLIFSEKDTADDALEALFDQKILNSSLIVERNGLRLGIFGILGRVATGNAPQTHPVKFKDPVKTAQKYVRYLRETGKADMVICLSHSGITMDKNGDWSGEDVLLATKVPGIDLIISGHTHILLEKPLIINGTPVVLAGCHGAWVGRYEVGWENGRICQLDARVIPVTNAISPDTLIRHLIAEQEQVIAEQILKPCNLFDSTIVAETSFPLICNLDTLLEDSNLGLLISDAVWSWVNSNNHPGTDITLFPAGLISDNIFPGKTGKQTVADIFRIIPQGYGKDNIPGYPLARVYVTGHELKGLMEVLYLAPSLSRDNYIYTGGLRATFDPEKGLLRKITSIEVGSPEKGFMPVDCSKRNKKLYSITADSYVLGFVSIIKKLSKHMIVITLKNERGEPIRSIDDAVIDADADTPGIQEVKEWMTLVWFLQQQPDINGNGISDIPVYYSTGNPGLRRE